MFTGHRGTRRPSDNDVDIGTPAEGPTTSAIEPRVPSTVLSDADIPDALRRLTSSFSLELTPRQAQKIERFSDHVRPGTSVYITFLSNTPFSETVETVRRLALQAMRPVPHLAARAIQNRRHLDAKLAALTGEGDVEEILLIGGSLPEPAGDFDATIQILRSGCIERHGIRRVGLAGHPEGNPHVSGSDLRQALKEKNEFAAESPLELYLVTQFCFAPEPVVGWEREIRADGNQLPVHVGLPGLALPATLLKFGLSCGVGPSLKVLRQQAGNLVKMATSPAYCPDQTMVGVARAASSDPAALFRSFHFFPFGAFARTANWAGAVADGHFSIEQTTGRIRPFRPVPPAG
jgi:methylenetetrahydrofolate reductase (NADPH)